MVLKPTLADIKSIGFYLGRVIIGLSLTMLLPFIFAFLAGEMNPFLDF